MVGVRKSNSGLQFSTTVVNVPGLGNSGKKHWQTQWEALYDQNFIRINQENWMQPNKHDWINAMEVQLNNNYDFNKIILVGHSVGCATIVHWCKRFGRVVKGALLVAPSDVDAENYPDYITGFSPMPLNKLPFPTIVVASTNDHVVSLERAKFFAQQWDSEFIELIDEGHIEVFSEQNCMWSEGLRLLLQLENKKQ